MAVRKKRVLTAAQKAAKAARAKRRRQARGGSTAKIKAQNQRVDARARQRERVRASKRIAKQNLAMNRKGTSVKAAKPTPVQPGYKKSRSQSAKATASARAGATRKAASKKVASAMIRDMQVARPKRRRRRKKR